MVRVLVIIIVIIHLIYKCCAAISSDSRSNNTIQIIDFANDTHKGSTIFMVFNYNCLDNLNVENEIDDEVVGEELKNMTFGKKSIEKLEVTRQMKIIRLLNKQKKKILMDNDTLNVYHTENAIFSYEALKSLNMLLIKVNSYILKREKLLSYYAELPCLEVRPAYETIKYLDTNTNIIESNKYSKANKKTPLSQYFWPKSQKSFKSLLKNDMFLPNDPFIEKQWYLFGPKQNQSYGANVVEGWLDIYYDLIGNNTTAEKNFTYLQSKLKPIEIALVDSGCALHNDLLNNISYNTKCKYGQSEYLDNKTNTYKSCSENIFTDELQVKTYDSQNHGTGSAGIIAAETNNNVGIAGICQSCKIKCLNVVNSKTGIITTSSIVRAIDYIISNRIQISNHSYGGYGRDILEQLAFDKLENTKMHLAFTAAGNARCNIGCKNLESCPRKCNQTDVWTPAAFKGDYLVVVGASDKNGFPSSFSNVGDDAVHILAPGEEIISLANGDKNSIVFFFGTSFATPIVTSAAALLWSAVPCATPLEIKESLLEGANKTRTTKYYSMSGILDVKASLHSGWAVDQAILKEDKKLVAIRFGIETTPNCKIMDELLFKVAKHVNNICIIYVVDIIEVPDFNEIYELTYDVQLMFFFRNKHMLIDIGTGDNNKITAPLSDKNDLIEIIELIYRGAIKGKGLVESPKDFSIKYKY